MSIASASASVEFADRPAIRARLHHSIGESYLELDLPARAESEFREAVRLRGELHGTEHPSTLESRRGFALSRTLRGDHDGGLAILREVASSIEAALGPDHVESLAAENTVAMTLFRMQRYDEAAELMQSILERRVRTLGPASERTLLTRMDLALVHLRRGDFVNAQERLDALLGDVVAIGGLAAIEEQVKTNLANVYLGTRAWTEAEALMHEVLESQERRLGRDHRDTLATLNNLAVSLQRQGRNEEALALAERTLASKRRRLGERHAQTLRSMNNVASLLIELDRFDEAAAMLDALLAIDEEVQPGTENHGVHIHTRAEVEIARRDWRAADRGLSRAIAVYRQTGGAYLGYALAQAAGVRAQMGDATRALEHLDEAIAHGHAGSPVNDPLLAPLADDPRFLEIVERGESSRAFAR